MKKMRFNEDWMFAFGSGAGFASLFGGGEAPKKVTLPHDASVIIERNANEPNGSGNGYFQEKSCHYEKTFTVAEEDAEKEVFIEFEGVYQNAYVYINDSFAERHPYGYGNFYVHATRFIRFGENNKIKVIIKNDVPSGRWYTGCGIYRDVNLLIGNRLRLVPDMVHFSLLELEEDLAAVQVESTIAYSGVGTRDIVYKTELFDAEGNLAAQEEMPITIMEHSENVYRQRLFVDEPKLWDTEHPYLYTYKASILEGDQILDEETGIYGIRKITLDNKHGLRINGKEVKLRGGCIHHDNGVIGTAAFPHAEEFRVRVMKEAGYNSIRSSHYPMGRRLLEACDKLGMLVMDEYSDVWTTTKVDFDYGMHVADWWEYDITNLVNKDFNHPSVIMYSIGNEIPETGDKFDTQWGKKFADLLRKLDPTRLVTNSLNLMLSVMSKMESIMPQIMAENGMSADSASMEGSSEINSLMTNLGAMMDLLISSDVVGKMVEESSMQVDAIGYNYGASRYVKDVNNHPNKIIIGSETYPRDLDINWKLVMENPRVLGDYSWTAWDYLGEAGIGKISYDTPQGMMFYAPYPCKAAYCGDMNLLGDRRPVSYWREMIWGLRTAPYLCVQLPEHYGQQKSMSNWCMTDAVRSWNWSGFEGKPVVVEAYTMAEEAALYKNGTLVEKKAVGTEKTGQVFFDTTYEPGTLELVVYTSGEETGRDMIQTASADVSLVVTADEAVIPADASDICFVEISVCDAAGNLNMEITTPVSVSIEGPGVILGYGSADPESEENYFDTIAKPYEGRLRAAVRGIGEAGVITVTVSGDGLEAKSVSIEAK